MNLPAMVQRFVIRRGTVAAAVLVLVGAVVPPARDARATELVVSVPGPGSTISLPIELIGRIGADRAEGVIVRVRFVGGGGLALDDLMKRNSDFAVLGLPSAMLLRARDPRVVALAAIDDLPLYVLSVRADLRGKVKTVADLRGRVVGVHSDSLTTKTTSHQLAELVLLRHGVALDSVRFAAVGQSWETQYAALKTAAVDAVMSDEPFASRLEARRIAFPLFSTGDPDAVRNIPGAGFLRATLVSRDDVVNEHSDRAAAMVRIVKRVLDWIATHTPEEIVERLGLVDAEERRELIGLLHRYPHLYSRDGRFSARQLRETEAFFRASNPGDDTIRTLSLDAMIFDRWSGRKD